jgi:2-polyprenyl-3-methyl-5-hydroxy-6-metoxy-1,4-benzoquinol methylase
VTSQSSDDAAAHWQAAYDSSGPQDVSWFQREPVMSLRLLAAAGLQPGSSLIDVGGGASILADRVLTLGVTDVTVLDIAEPALRAARDRLGDQGGTVTWLVQDLLTWSPQRRYDIWHDRAVYHFLTDPEDRDRYWRVLDAALADDGHVVIGTFAEDGPVFCSGLPVARYAAAALAEQFAGFDVMATDREEHHTPSGRVQPFTWLVLGRVTSSDPSAGNATS